MKKKFDKSEIIDALTELGAEAVKADKIIDLCIYGGSCLMLVTNFREASQDVDGVATTDQAFIDRVARQIADKRSWHTDWLNDGVRTYLSPNVEPLEHHEMFKTYPSESQPGLRVYVPSAEYMLAMKLMALRIDDLTGEKDKADIENLMSVVGIGTKAELIDLAAQYYPEARVSAKLIMSADRLVAAAAKKRQEPGESPRYLERRGRRG